MCTSALLASCGSLRSHSTTCRVAPCQSSFGGAFFSPSFFASDAIGRLRAYGSPDLVREGDVNDAMINPAQMTGNETRSPILIEPRRIRTLYRSNCPYSDGLVGDFYQGASRSRCLAFLDDS